MFRLFFFLVIFNEKFIYVVTWNFMKFNDKNTDFIYQMCHLHSYMTKWCQIDFNLQKFKTHVEHRVTILKCYSQVMFVKWKWIEI